MDTNKIKTFFEILYKRIMANTSTIWQQVGHTTLNYYFQAAWQEPYKKKSIS